MSAFDQKAPRAPFQEPAAGERLESWKEIATYLHRDVRTVQRWEHTKGLPVHRLGIGNCVPVYALSGELDRWWSGESPTSLRWLASNWLPVTLVAVAFLIVFGGATWWLLSWTASFPR